MIRTKPAELEKFHELLMGNAPADYTPWYFPVKRDGKDPDAWAIAKRAPPEIPKGARGSWKAPWARLTYEEALARLEAGGNNGFAARANDQLVIYDVDKPGIPHKVETLRVKSRKRIAGHSFAWAREARVKLNIATGDMGEVRSCDQYVVAAGSFVPTTEDELNKMVACGEISEEKKQEIQADPLRGVYSVELAQPPATISLSDLPEIFLERLKKEQAFPTNTPPQPKKPIFKPQQGRRHSALFALTIENVVGNFKQSARFPHPLHASETGANFSISNGLGHCWRHMVSLNPLQFLVVKSGYMECQDAGTGHSGSHASRARGDAGALQAAWLQARRDGLIPENDPMPGRVFKRLDALSENELPAEAKLAWRREKDLQLIRRRCG